MSVVLALIAQLYQLEKYGRDYKIQGEQLRLLRDKDARPVLNQLRSYLLQAHGEVLPKSDAGQAIAYALNHWSALTRYLEDGDLSIDNNSVERSLRGVAVGSSLCTSFSSV